MSSSSFSLRGVADLAKRLKDISTETRSNLSSAAEDEANAIVLRSQNEFVPEREGRLKNTIKVVKSTLSQGRDRSGQFTSGADIEIKIIAGDETTPYALTIHEYPSEHNPPSWEGVDVQFNPSGRGPKFLEKPLNESIDGMAERIAVKVKI